MSKSLTVALPMMLVLFVISIGACGGLTFTTYNQWRTTSLLEDEYKEAKDQIRESDTLMDRLFNGENKFIAHLYEPLPEDKKADYKKAKVAASKGDTEDLDAMFADLLLPSPWLPRICVLALILFGFLTSKVFKPTFVEFSGRMALTTTLVGILGGYFAYLGINNIYPMGIDLAGGTELIYRLDYESTERRLREAKERLDELERKKDAGEKENGKPVTDEMIQDLRITLSNLEESKRTAPEKATEVVRKRVDPNGTRGIPITKYGEGRLRIQLPKASPEDVERIKRAIRTQGRLTFHIVTEDQEIIRKVKKSPTKEHGAHELKLIEKKDKYQEKKITTDEVVITKLPELEGSRIVFAGYRRNIQQGGYEVNIRFDGAGAARFEEVTAANLKKRLAIVLDGKCYSAPVIQSVISADCQITGNFSKKEAENLAAVLTAGSLPAEVKEDSEFTVGPSLGREQIRSGVVATIIGALLVALFIWTFYRVGGFISVLCLSINLTVLMGALGFFKATMTLPGIAGILLTMGMAVDANVLIFERIREEIARGRVLRLAVQHGFDRAVVTILDSQLTTLLSAVILYYLGTGPIRGFAVTLSLGILVTLFANLWVCRNIIEWLVSVEAITSLKSMQFLTNTKIDFMGIRKPWVLTSGTLLLASVAGFTYLGIFNNKIYDLDFTGGTLIQFNFQKGKEHTSDQVGEIADGKMRPKVKERLEQAVTHLEAVAASGQNEVGMRKDLYAKLPVIGRSQFGSASTVDRGSLLSLAEKIKKVLKEWKLVEFSTEPFSSPIEGDTEKYRSFTLTTRMTEAAAVEVLNDELLKHFGGLLELPAIEANQKERRLLIRFDPETDVSDEYLVAHMDAVLRKVAGAKQNESIKKNIEELKVTPVKTEAYGEGGKRRYIELTGLSSNAEMQRKVQDAVEEAKIENRAEGAISRKSSFGSQVAGEMRTTALFAALGALAGIFLYLWFRFQFSSAWGFGAICALFHDALMAIGAVCLFNVTGWLHVLIDLNLVAAIMTIIGYSVNDTIVTFDRIREIRTQHPTRDLKDVLNEAINRTLSRTFLTSATTLLATLSLFIFGGETIRDLSFTLLVGIMVGTYSSIFVASPAMMWWINKYGAGKAPVPGAGKPKGEVSPQGAQI